MKITILITAIFTLLFVQNRIFGQIPPQELNQVELLKKFVGTWRAVISKDTALIWECMSLGKAIEFTLKDDINGKISITGRSLLGYDKTTRMLLESVILTKSPNITLCPSWFNSPNSFEQISLKDLSHPEAATWKWSIEFKSSELFILTETTNSKISFTRTFIKQTS